MTLSESMGVKLLLDAFARARDGVFEGRKERGRRERREERIMRLQSSEPSSREIGAKRIDYTAGRKQRVNVIDRFVNFSRLTQFDFCNYAG